MSILLNKDTKVIVQGITGDEANFWLEKMINFGTNIIAGVTPGKGGKFVNDVPVYNSINSLVRDKGDVDLSVLFVPPKFAKDAAYEAIDNEINTVIILADGLPAHDCMEINNYAKKANTRIIGPNTPGLASFGKGMVGFIPYWLNNVYQYGNVGLMARSGSLTNLLASKLYKHDLGISSFVGVGGDPIPGSRFSDIALLFEEDEETDYILMVGELGGSMEQEVADLFANNKINKPVVSYIAGEYSPNNKQMGHAGAIVKNDSNSVKEKNMYLEQKGVITSRTAEDAAINISKLFKGDL